VSGTVLCPLETAPDTHFPIPSLFQHLLQLRRDRVSPDLVAFFR